VFTLVDPMGSARRQGSEARAVLCLAAVAVALASLAATLDPETLCVLPMLVLLALLAVRRFPGERALASRAAPPPARPAARVSVQRAGDLVVQAVPRGGLLMARFLAVRPPPFVRPAST